MRREARPWGSLYRGLFIDVGLKEEISRTNAANPLQRILRMSEVIEDAVEQHQIKRSQAPRLEVIDIHQESRCIGLPGGFDDIEASHGIRERIDSDDLASASLFGLERKKTFSAPDVQNAHACKIFGQSKIR